MSASDPVSAPSPTLILRHRFDPPDNRRLAELCGPFDAHLRSIEQSLQVSIVRRDA
jgi:phosphate starvation-inducible PhoH-like protein